MNVEVLLRPGNSSAFREVGLLPRHVRLVYVLVWREIIARYKQSILGLGLAIVQPLMMTLVFTFIFGHVAKVDTGDQNYAMFAYAGILPWTYFQRCLTASGTSLTSYGGILSKIYFPRLIAPLTSLGVALTDLLIAMLVFVVVAALFGQYPDWRWIFIPVIFIYGALISLSFSLWIAALNVNYRDIQHMMPYIVQALMYLTPVAYPTSAVPAAYQTLYALNPIVGYLDFSRWVLIGGDAPLLWPTIASLGISALFMIGGLILFGRVAQTFADRL